MKVPAILIDAAPALFTLLISVPEGRNGSNATTMNFETLNYMQPAVEVINVDVEKGFANSQLESPGEGGDI